MKKIFRTFLIGIAFTTATFFMSCTDVISEDEQQQKIEQIDAVMVDIEVIQVATAFQTDIAAIGADVLAEDAGNHKNK